MTSVIYKTTNVFPAPATYNLSMLLFRLAVSLQLMLAHGLKKIGIGVPVAEVVPNPLHLPEVINQTFAIASNLIFPVLVILGLFSRLASAAILAVTLTGYFVVHWHDSLLEKDMPYMYSVAYLLILLLGPGKYAIDYLINRPRRKMI